MFQSVSPFFIRLNINGISAAGAEPRSELRTAASHPDSDRPAERTPAVPGRQFSGGGGFEAHKFGEISPGGGGCAPAARRAEEARILLQSPRHRPDARNIPTTHRKSDPNTLFYRSKDRLCRRCGVRVLADLGVSAVL